MTLELPSWASPLISECQNSGEDVDVALKLAADYGRLLPQPGRGETAFRWAVLAAVGEHNLTVARVLEAHSDALAILNEAGAATPEGTWGVFAAEAAPHRLEAHGSGARVTLNGVKPWCSLAARLSSALVTAHVRSDERQLFRVSLRHPSVTAESPGTWVARGLRNVVSAPVRFEATPAEPVGPPGWYLTRPGFAWGGMGVAACWHGGARGLRTTLVRGSK